MERRVIQDNSGGLGAGKHTDNTCCKATPSLLQEGSLLIQISQMNKNSNTEMSSDSSATDLKALDVEVETEGLYDHGRALP